MPEITIEKLWAMVNAGAEKQQGERKELISFREKWEKLKNLLPGPGELLKPAEIAGLPDRLSEILRS